MYLNEQLPSKPHSLDATQIRLTPEQSGDDTHESFLSQEWLLEVQSGKDGGITCRLDPMHLSDILSDSGIEEPGDINTLNFKLSTWVPSRLLNSWVSFSEVGELYLSFPSTENSKISLNLERIVDDGYEVWEIFMSSRLWLDLCKQVIKETSSPKFPSRDGKFHHPLFELLG